MTVGEAFRSQGSGGSIAHNLSVHPLGRGVQFIGALARAGAGARECGGFAWGKLVDLPRASCVAMRSPAGVGQPPRTHEYPAFRTKMPFRRFAFRFATSSSNVVRRSHKGHGGAPHRGAAAGRPGDAGAQRCALMGGRGHPHPPAHHRDKELLLHCCAQLAATLVSALPCPTHSPRTCSLPPHGTIVSQAHPLGSPHSPHARTYPVRSR